jgi:hypothetical protein
MNKWLFYLSDSTECKNNKKVKMMNDYNGIISTTVQKHLHGFSTLFAITFYRKLF